MVFNRTAKRSRQTQKQPVNGMANVSRKTKTRIKHLFMRAL
jgi:hypothetical protein